MATIAASVLIGAALAGCGDVNGTEVPRTTEQSEGPELPQGWRWESFAGVQVGVPGDWDWTNASQRISQWCVGEGRREPLTPAVGRPGASTLVGCDAFDKDVPQEMLVQNTGEIVAFEPVVDQEKQREDAGDRLTVTKGGVRVIIQTSDEALRARIAETVHRVDVDAYGCPVDDPAARRPKERPDSVIDLADPEARGRVAWVSACRHTTVYPDRPSDLPTLVGSRRFDGAAAAALLDTLVAAAPGTGPNAPETCAVEWAYGDELIVLRLHLEGSDHDVHRVLVRYSGCDHHGSDDGTTRRVLTRDLMQALLGEGLDRPSSYSGEVADILAR
jgi:hypothetical protein